MRNSAFAGCLLLLALMGCGSREAAETPKFAGKVVSSYAEATQSAKSENKPVLVVVYRGNFQMVENNLLNDPALKERGGKFITAALDADKADSGSAQLNVTKFPAFLILKPDGTESWRSEQMTMPGQVAQLLDQVNAGSH